MFVLKDNFSVNAREVSKINSSLHAVDEYVDEISRGIIFEDDLLCFKKKKTEEVEESFIVCKPFNITPLAGVSFFLFNDNVGGEPDQFSVSVNELDSISVLRFNKKLGGN